MMWFDKEYNYIPKVDNAEMYRQHYEDALDEIRNLKFKIAELETIISENRENIIIVKKREKD